MRNENIMSDNTDEEMTTNKIPNKDTNSYNTITDRHIVPDRSMSHKEHIKEDNQKVRPKKTKISICEYKQPSNLKTNKTNSKPKLTYRKLMNIINKSLDTNKELSHSSIAQVSNVNTIRLSFMNNKDSVYCGNRK